MPNSFFVVAGKFEGDERNYKFISSAFPTFEGAYTCYLTAKDYPFSEIEMVTKDGETHTIVIS